LRLLVCLAAFFNAGGASAESFADNPEVAAFITQLVDEQGFERRQLLRWFQQARLQRGVLQAMARPGTARPWHEFRAGVLTPARIRDGIEYWRRHAATLARAATEFGVPEEIMVATIGIETQYGRAVGRSRVFDALATLAFAYPPRAELFRGELAELLLLARERHFDPTRYRGSYAGALGVPQFLPSSYRRYAVDFNGDGGRDLWNHDDAIGSIGNYYKAFGWIAGQPVLSPIERSNEPPGDAFRALLERGIKPHSTVAAFRRSGVSPAGVVADDLLACAFAAETESGTAYWLGFNNFYVITRYNRSINYALAVHDLALELRRQREQPAE
jgi:membrane-bound lytic murein transglycosylase B